MHHAEPPPSTLRDGSESVMRRAFPAAIGALVCVHASMAATRVTATLLALHLGYAEWVLGALLSLFAVAPIGLSLWAGRLADRHGLHRPLHWGAGLGVLGASVAVVSQHPMALALAALLTGGAIAVAAVGIQREAGLMARDASDLKRVFSWVSLGPAVSNALTPVAVGLLIDHVGFRPGFVLAAVLPLLAVALGRWVPRREGVGQAVETASTFGGAVSTRPGIRVLLQRAPFRRLILVNLALSSGWDAHSFTVPLLGHARGYSASTIGFILGAFALAATVVRLFISRWADDLDESKALQAAMALACVVFATYAAFPGPVGMCCASALLGLALGAVQPMVLSLLHQVTPSDQHGLALGFRMMATHLATIAMPLGFGLLAAASAAAAPMWLVAGLIALALIPARHLAPAHPSRGA